MVSFWGVRSLQLFDSVTIKFTFDVFNFSGITIGSPKKLKTSKVNYIVTKSKSWKVLTPPPKKIDHSASLGPNTRSLRHSVEVLSPFKDFAIFGNVNMAIFNQIL